MKIHNLTENSLLYTSNAYLITGDQNALSDVNTLIDTGRDPLIMENIMKINTGVGKKAVEQVVLTHSHYDHTECLPAIIRRYKPLVLGFSRSLPLIDVYLYDGMLLKIGNQKFEVIHIPGHSEDSVCLYCKNDKILFAGDTPLNIRSTDSTYDDVFIKAFSRLCQLDIQTIYWGHGTPTVHNCCEMIRSSWINLLAGQYSEPRRTNYEQTYYLHSSLKDKVTK